MSRVCCTTPQVLYCCKAWTRFLLGLDTRYLLAFYIKFLYDGFQ